MSPYPRYVNIIKCNASLLQEFILHLHFLCGILSPSIYFHNQKYTLIVRKPIELTEKIFFSRNNANISRNNANLSVISRNVRVISRNIRVIAQKNRVITRKRKKICELNRLSYNWVCKDTIIFKKKCSISLAMFKHLAWSYLLFRVQFIFSLPDSNVCFPRALCLHILMHSHFSSMTLT